MSIPNVDRSAIDLALSEFDQILRPSAEWLGWDKKASQRYAISINGQLYPPKQIVSMATGLPVSDFMGGRPTNSYLEQRKFPIVNLAALREPFSLVPAPSFTIGRIYDRWTEIHEPYGGSRQSGICPSSKTSAIFLFTGESGHQFGYEDRRSELGVFSYTGEGQVGDMEFSRGNLAIRDHANEGRALHLFRLLGKGKGQEYLGEHACAGYAINTGKDKNGRQRKTIVFHLVPVEMVSDERLSDLGDDPNDRIPSSLEEARQRALAAFSASDGENGGAALRTLYRRSKHVKEYVLLRAAGRCESCFEPAPFKKRDGTEYLEPHHTTRVSDGGLDHPRFVAALCPACHRHIHYGQGGEEKNRTLAEMLAIKEPD
jgi:5-methylcytosine-specific restriction protein A